VADILE